jgi:hypothetical protein
MPGKRDNREVTYLTDEEVAGLNEQAERAGKSKSMLIRAAVREYLDLDRGDRVERKLAELTDEVADLRALVEADQTHTPKMAGLSEVSAITNGGRPDEYTAENVADADPPPTNASVTRKVEYLAALVENRAEKRLHRQKFRDKEVLSTWAYADEDRADALVEKTIAELGLKQHPAGNPLYVTPEEHDRLEAELNGNDESEVAETFNAIENAEAAND